MIVALGCNLDPITGVVADMILDHILNQIL